MKQASFLVFPSECYENFPITIGEAYACGVPVISYDAGGQKEAIRDGVNGFIVNINDSEAMLRLVRKIVEDPLLCRSLSQGARRYAEINFDFDRYIDDLLEYYHEVI